MGERHQIRISVSQTMFEDLEKRADEAGTSVPGYVGYLVNRNADAHAIWLADQSARWSILAAMMTVHWGHFPKSDLTQRDFHRISMAIDAILGDAPKPPAKLLSLGRFEGGSFVAEMARLYGKFTAAENELDRGEQPWTRICSCCRRSYYS